MLILFVALLLLPSLLLGSYLPDPATEKVLLIPELERLAKILGPEIAKYPQFSADFHIEAGRRNVSIKSYANTCGYAFLEMIPSPAEYNFQGDLKATAEFMVENGLTELPSNWSDISPLAHSFITTRRAAIQQLSTLALPETVRFMQDAEEAALVFISNRMRDEVMRLNAGQHGNTKKPDRMAVLVTQVALRYKDLSAEARADLEISFCARNALRWWSHRLNATKMKLFNEEMFEKFTSIVGLNVDKILAESDYFSQLPLNEVKTAFGTKAESINVLSQEYVDTCAETISSLKMSRDEEVGMKTVEAMGEGWGKEVHDNVEKVLDLLRKENATFIRFYTKRVNFFNQNLHQLTPKTQTFVKQLNKDFLNVMVTVNNRVATGGTERLETFSNATKERLRTDEAMLRELEQVFCLQSALTAIKEKPVTVAEVLIIGQ